MSKYIQMYWDMSSVYMRAHTPGTKCFEALPWLVSNTSFPVCPSPSLPVPLENSFPVLARQFQRRGVSASRCNMEYLPRAASSLWSQTRTRAIHSGDVIPGRRPLGSRRYRPPSVPCPGPQSLNSSLRISKGQHVTWNWRGQAWHYNNFPGNNYNAKPEKLRWRCYTVQWWGFKLLQFVVKIGCTGFPAAVLPNVTAGEETHFPSKVGGSCPLALFVAALLNPFPL